jgi:hypothetical protein
MSTAAIFHIYKASYTPKKKKKKSRKNGLEAFRSGCCEGNTTRTLRELVKEGIFLVLLALLMLAKLNTSESQHQ